MNIYILDYDYSIVEFYKNFFLLEFPKIQVKYFHNDQSFLEAIQNQKPELVILEFEIEQPFDVFEKLQKEKICFIVVSRFLTERIVVESLKHGAYDFVHKRNLKHNYFKKILARAFLDVPRWQKLIDISLNARIYPEYERYDEELKQLAMNWLHLEAKLDFPLPSFIEGKIYTLNFLTVRIPITRELLSYLIEEELQKIHQEWILKMMDVISYFNGAVWIRKNDAFTSVFHSQNYMDPLLAALQIQAHLAQILSTLEIENLHCISCIGQGTVTYSKEKSNLYSEAINLTYHMVERLPLNYKIYITQNIYQGLNERAKAYFFKEDNPFEGNTIFRFEYLA